MDEETQYFVLGNRAGGGQTGEKAHYVGPWEVFEYFPNQFPTDSYFREHLGRPLAAGMRQFKEGRFPTIYRITLEDGDLLREQLGRRNRTLLKVIKWLDNTRGHAVAKNPLASGHADEDRVRELLSGSE